MSAVRVGAIHLDGFYEILGIDEDDVTKIRNVWKKLEGKKLLRVGFEKLNAIYDYEILGFAFAAFEYEEKIRT